MAIFLQIISIKDYQLFSQIGQNWVKTVGGQKHVQVHVSNSTTHFVMQFKKPFWPGSI
jgi:hypothetical protein